MVIISAAYGRNYRSGQEAIEDFRAGKDFRHHILDASGTYCSIRDFPTGQEVMIRFNNFRSLTIYVIRGDEDGRI